MRGTVAARPSCLELRVVKSGVKGGQLFGGSAMTTRQPVHGDP
jgi:hypothetical protein